MNRKILVALLALMMITSSMTFTAMAAITPPAALGAPEHFGVSHYLGDYFIYTTSAPDDIRAFMADITAAGLARTTMVLKAQIDYKLDNGNWHYTSAWDTASSGLKNTLSVSYILGERYIYHSRESLSNMFPEDKAILQPVKDNGWNYFKNHSISFRIRYAASINNSKDYIYSSWSNTFVFSNSVKSDPDKLMNHAPTLTSASVVKNSGGMPFLNIKTGRLPGEVQDLNAMTAEGVWTEVWMKKTGDKDFKLINDSSFFSNEFILIGVDDYFDKTKPNYDAESYQIKIRYKIDLRKYLQGGRSDTIYSPFSNVFSQNMPSWSEASPWATQVLKDAADKGLIPDSLKGVDMTRPITREEFAELAVLLYEKTTNKTSLPISPNPFTDTANPQVLKAFNLSILSGTSATTFSPQVLINREQCAAMLFRTMKAIAPQGDYSTEGVKDFTDQKDISSWAVNVTKYMSKVGVIVGDAKGNFMPKALTTAQIAAGYGMATREQAIAMAVRTYEKFK